MNRFIIPLMAVAIAATPAKAVEYQQWVDWDQIQHWAGDPEGENRCALVIDFQDGQTECSYVWGYRWNGTKTGEDLVRAVAGQSSVLSAMIQYTGTMGSTLNSLGISANREELDYLYYDFDRAAIGGEVSFGFFEPNTSMGQETAPGYAAEQMCVDAIERAKTTGIIEHPLNAFLYGYPAYDYDYWQLEDGYADTYEYRWRSGWYDGYWSYWHGPNDYEYIGYSGLGMSSTVLVNDGVQAWKYIVFGGEYYGGELHEELDYAIADYGEEMHEAVEAVQPVDQNNVKFWVGTGEKAATVVFQFNDGRGPENLVYGYRWSGGWDDDLKTVITTIANADPRMTATIAGKNIQITYDSNDDGTLDANDHTDVADTWNCYVKRTIDEDFNKVPSGRWLNPNAVMILSHQPEDMAEVSLPYQLFRPEIDSDQLFTLPEVIDYALADEALTIPVFLEAPAEGGKFGNSFSWTRDTQITSITSGMGTTAYMGKVNGWKNFAPKSGTVKVRGQFTKAGETKSAYYYSNDATLNIAAPVRPVTNAYYAESEVSARLSHPVDNALVFEPADATFTKFSFSTSNSRAATVNSTSGEVKTTTTAGSADINAAYIADSNVTASFSLTSQLVNAVEDVTFEAADEDGVITLTPKEMAGLKPIFTPEDPDINTIACKLEGNGTAKDNYIATMYNVNLWDENNVMTRMPELSGHRVGECTLKVSSNDGTGFEKTFTVRVVEPEREPAIDYTAGTIMLNEEWFGHTNGGLNWYSPEYDIVYQAYERENPGMSFGCTSAFGMIYDGKLIVSSKQASDGGDPLPGGGRLVVADANTLQRLGSLDELKVDGETRSGDGRGLCGAGHGRIYQATHSGIYIVDTENCAILGKVAGSGNGSSSNLYAGQVGDMLLAGRYAFAVAQDKGILIIDTDTDEIVKTIDDKQVQGIAQSADGHVWYATLTDSKASRFVALDCNTLEAVDAVDVPAEYGSVACGWGAWRPTQFTSSHSVNSLFFCPGSSISNGGGGVVYRYDIDSREFRRLAQVSDLPAHTAGMKQGAYGTIRYDDRTGEIIAGTTEFKASGHYRYNWTHFIDAETGEITRTIELRPYYWFQAMPIFPDVYEAEMEDIDDITLKPGDEPLELTLNVTDRDNHDANIRISLVDGGGATRAEAAEAPVEVALEGNKLTITPKALGSHTIGIALESNGRVSTHAINVTVSDQTGIDAVGASEASIASRGNAIIVRGCAGSSFSVCDVTGTVADTFTAESDVFVRETSLAAGVYIVVADNGLTKKIIIR